MARKVNYRKILKHYRLDDPLIEQYFEKDSFENAEYDRIAQDYLNDCSLALGMEYVLRKRLKENMFLIINAGAPHLPLMGCILKRRNYLPHFYIKGSAPSCTDSFLNFSSVYGEIEVKDPLPAMMFDAHAEFDKEKALPTPKKLKKLGIKECLILVEYNYEPLNHSYHEHPEFESAAKMYVKNGIETEIVEVDPRPREKDFERVIDMLKEDKEFTEWFSSLLRTEPKECIKTMKKGLKDFFE
jgi:sulfur carrier protein ThiS